MLATGLELYGPQSLPGFLAQTWTADILVNRFSQFLGHYVLGKSLKLSLGELYELCSVSVTATLADPPPFPAAHRGCLYVAADSGFRWFSNRGSRDLTSDFKSAGWDSFKFDALTGATLETFIPHIKSRIRACGGGITAGQTTRILGHEHTLMHI